MIGFVVDLVAWFAVCFGAKTVTCFVVKSVPGSANKSVAVVVSGFVAGSVKEILALIVDGPVAESITKTRAALLIL